MVCKKHLHVNWKRLAAFKMHALIFGLLSFFVSLSFFFFFFGCVFINFWVCSIFHWTSLTALSEVIHTTCTHTCVRAPNDAPSHCPGCVHILSQISSGHEEFSIIFSFVFPRISRFYGIAYHRKIGISYMYIHFRCLQNDPKTTKFESKNQWSNSV